MEIYKRVLMAWITVISVGVRAQRSYDMDNFSTCGRTLTVDESGLRLLGRGNVAPSNPPLECIVYLMSVYKEDDGTNKLEIEVENIVLRDANVRLALYEGRNTAGTPLRSLGSGHGSTDLIYSNGREITVKFSRPNRLLHTDYQFTLFIKPFKDRNARETTKKVDSLSVGAIIGIIIGCLILVALIILFCWCCCTGRLGNFNVPGRSIKRPTEKSYANNGNYGYNSSKKNIDNFQDSVVWNTVTTGKYDSGTYQPRFQKGAPRNNFQIGRRFEHEDRNPPPDISQNRQSANVYEPYESDNRQKATDRNIHQSARQTKKETMIDDVFDSDSNTKDSDLTENTLDDEMLQEKERESQHGSPKSNRKRDMEIPEERNIHNGSPQLQKYLSVDLESQPDLDTISSPLHINAGVRASVEDEAGSPAGSLRKKGGKPPKSNRLGHGREPDPMAMPPEAFEPIFTKPITGIDYPAPMATNPYGPVQGYPGGMIPYGLIPAGAFAPVAPGTQTYAYAYQTVPQHGVPGQQGAWVVQNTPTTEGNRQTAFAVKQTLSPDKSIMLTPESRRRKNSDPFKRSGPRVSGGSKKGGKDKTPDLSVIARGAAPPDPGQGHRSIAMKSGTDPQSGVHKTQVVWTDTVPDATDPEPGDNPQITRKTITRVTTKSGYADLPPETELLALDEAEPAFLSPSTSRLREADVPSRAILPAVSSPARENLAFYTGAGDIVSPPERSSTPTSTHQPPAYNRYIRDRIPLDDSTV